MGAPPFSRTSFQVGTISFINGTSLLNTIIFGATLSFYLNSVTPQNFIGSDNIVLNTTSNVGTLNLDADYINICGSLSNICGKSINAFEQSEGGTGVSVALLGTIIGDPELHLLDLSLQTLRRLESYKQQDKYIPDRSVARLHVL